MKWSGQIVASFLCIFFISACGVTGDPVNITISSVSGPRTIPARSKIVNIYAVLPNHDVSAKELTGKLLIGGKTFDMAGDENISFTYTTTDFCSVFPSGLQNFRYKLFRGTILYAEDSIQVEVNC